MTSELFNGGEIFNAKINKYHINISAASEVR